MKRYNFYYLLILFLIILLFFISIKLIAQQKSADFKTLIEILKKIGASDQQIKEVIKIYQESLEKTRPLNIELKRLRLDFEEEYIKENPDENKLMEILEKIAKVELEIKKIQILAELQIRKVLGYELYLKFKALWEQAKKNS